MDGPWKGRKVIRCSLAVSPKGKYIIARGPYCPDAEELKFLIVGL